MERIGGEDHDGIGQGPGGASVPARPVSQARRDAGLTSSGPRTRRWPVAVAIVLIAFNLRPAFSSIAPVLNEIMADTGLTATGASVLTTAPVLCLGLFGPLAPWLARRIGTERTMLLVLSAILLGTGLRGLASVPALMAGSLIAGAGIGVGNVLMPSLLKRDFPDRAPLMTGIYIMSLSIGAAIASATTAPLRAALGGWWAGALAAWTLPAAVAIAAAGLAWAGQVGRQPAGAGRPAMRGVHGLWRDPLAWQVTLFMGLQSMLAYVVFGWMAPVLRGRGDTAVMAGLVVSVSVVFQVIASLPAPILAARMRRQSGPAAATMLVAAASFVALLNAPLSWQWALAAVLGLAQGAAFSLAILMIVLRAGDSDLAAQLSGMAQSVGYTMAAFGPLLAGVLHDWSGDWRGAGWLFVVGGLAAAAAGALAGRDRSVAERGRAVAVG
ncbi:MAG: MFS transporter [Acetobacteraceae bacterium]|nr:MFS transporter [Acetobacteraceae bacterium]